MRKKKRDVGGGWIGGWEGRKEGRGVRRRLPKEIESEVSVFRCFVELLSFEEDGNRWIKRF